MKKAINALFSALLCSITAASPVFAQNSYGLHDPAGIVKDNDRYHTFYTGNGVESAYSTDLCTWRRGSSVFSSGVPSWISTYVSGFRGHYWAPQSFYMNNRWHVYYSCSSWGSTESAIGVATTASLNNPDWEDQGMVVFTDRTSRHNAIDASVMRHDGRVWLTFGSYWSGIMMTELDTTTGKPIDRDDLHHVADGDPEGSYAIHHGRYYYLFFNRGQCCEGTRSTYYINVGRSQNPTGPFLDKEGKRTNEGGGTVLLKSQGRFIGPGHFGFFTENGVEYMSYHYYDGNQNGMSKLKISTLSWEDNWPVVNVDFNPCNPGNAKDCAGVANGAAYIDECGECVGGATGKEPCLLDCNGDAEGSATLDECGICTGGLTGMTPCIGSIEAESAIAFDGEIESMSEGFMGEGYVNMADDTGASATWELCADTASLYPLVFRYANGGDDCTVSLAVNETEQITDFEMPVTASWSDWAAVSAELSLEEGRNLVTLKTLTEGESPNIDILTFSDTSLKLCPTSMRVRRQGLPGGEGMHFKNGVVIWYSENGGSTRCCLYTVSGRRVRSIVKETLAPGFNTLHLDTFGLGAGVYLLVIAENGGAARDRLITIR